ncbi:SPOR domain-containing protein [Pseudomarimonas salicorniae]|uniref:SPOR domain-containing protein n=1 Tax=Pseudomarimonas salicorniae TaxID=2933270 RepID=A0ABT0GDY9_9GAMM|nr:SPOR domain-containing protein [Lysobacter sp. CAU 1642]MCK7592227.1 SPOR domain-containing protein [Lysobacter sp. CAU 1642]
MFARIVVLVLLVMNLGVGLWWWLRPQPAEPVVAASEPGVPALQLLSEQVVASAVPAEAEPVGPPQPLAEPEARDCLELGPWVTQVDVRRAMNVLTPAVNRIQFRETREVIRRGYRVFLASPGSREQALAIARELSARGLSDYYVVTAGDDQNSVSLGLFRDQNNANARLRQVRAQGFDAQLEPRNDELPQYWVDIDVDRGVDWRALLGRQGDIGTREIACELGEAAVAD